MRKRKRCLPEMLRLLVNYKYNGGCDGRSLRDRHCNPTLHRNINLELGRNMSTPKEVATLAGGCFWCSEAVFIELRGVEKVESGYSGGGVVGPTYEQVCTGTTGPAEAVQVTFDPSAISFREILQIFFTMHDPTTLNRQGADVGA